MSAGYDLHPEALFEFAGATHFYLQHVSARVANSFITAVESAIAAVTSAPTRWRVVEVPEIRRYICRRFPFVIYHR